MSILFHFSKKPKIWSLSHIYIPIGSALLFIPSITIPLILAKIPDSIFLCPNPHLPVAIPRWTIKHLTLGKACLFFSGRANTPCLVEWRWGSIYLPRWFSTSSLWIGNHRKWAMLIGFFLVLFSYIDCFQCLKSISDATAHIENDAF